MNRRRRPPKVTMYRNPPPLNQSNVPMLNWDMVEMTRMVRSDDFDSFYKYAKERTNWSDDYIKKAWESVHGYGTAPELEDVE